MARALAVGPTHAEVAELQDLAASYLVKMKAVNEQMTRDQAKIDRLKLETRLIAAETGAAMEGLQSALAKLRAS